MTGWVLSSGGSKGGPGWVMARPDFCLAPAWLPSFVFNFMFKFV